ncbi:MAG: hypothetical protein M3Z35_17175, partial [Nitrospirota bacterium]|nr:hypothetical protein [Nitrospirota bacterium]
MPIHSTYCAKEEQLEHALWSAISLFQRVEVLDELFAEAHRREWVGDANGRIGRATTASPCPGGSHSNGDRR